MHNNYRKVILDSSALMALINEDRSSEVIVPLLPRAIMSTISVMEFTEILMLEGYTKDEVQAIIERLVDEVVPFDTEQVYGAAEFTSQLPDIALSVGDKGSLALASSYKYPLYTANKMLWDIDLDGLQIMRVE